MFRIFVIYNSVFLILRNSVLLFLRLVLRDDEILLSLKRLQKNLKIELGSIARKTIMLVQL